MPFPMKIQPIDFNTDEKPARLEPVKPVMKSRLKRLFERQFPNVLRNSGAVENTGGFEELHFNSDNKDGSNGGDEIEPSSLCLAKMVQNFIEDSNEKHSSTTRNGRNRCNCFNGNSTESSEDDWDINGGFADSNFSSSVEVCELLKSLVPCPSFYERNLLTDTARLVEKNRVCKRKADFSRKIVTDGLLALGYDASTCKSRWEKSSSYPAGDSECIEVSRKNLSSFFNFAGDYEYIDVIVEGERLLIDIDFRSEFEIARSTKNYKAILQTLPCIFIGKADRLQKIISIVSEAAKQSLKKKGMHVPPWRKAEYVKAKWLSPYTRVQNPKSDPDPDSETNQVNPVPLYPVAELEPSREVETRLGEDKWVLVSSEIYSGEERWKPPELKPKNSVPGMRIVTGLASVFEDEP